jgi:hypothetical protein
MLHFTSQKRRRLNQEKRCQQRLRNSWNYTKAVCRSKFQARKEDRKSKGYTRKGMGSEPAELAYATHSIFVKQGIMGDWDASTSFFQSNHYYRTSPTLVVRRAHSTHLTQQEKESKWKE